jgi:hypothetical protein
VREASEQEIFTTEGTFIIGNSAGDHDRANLKRMKAKLETYNELHEWVNPEDVASLDPNHRGLLDTNSFFGSDDKPLVWETLRNKVEVYPGNSKKAKDPFDNGSPSENGPHYYYSPEEIDSCDGNTPLKNPYINLDEHDEIGLNVMSAGKAPTEPLLGQQFLYLAKANQQEYDYVKDLRWNITRRGLYFFDSAQKNT